MRLCKPRWMKKPYPDFIEYGMKDKSGYFCESYTHFYSLDGKRRLQKSGRDMIDNARRKTMRSDNREEREYWMKEWGIL